MSEPTPTAPDGGQDVTPDQAVRDGLAQHAQDTRDRPATSPDELATQAAEQGASPTEVDAGALLKHIQAMQARLEALEQEKRAGNAPPLVATLEAARDLVTAHAAHTPGTDHAEALSLADDLVDAGKNATQSGDLGYVREIGARLHKWLTRHHPGPGENSYYRQALDFTGTHLEDAADAYEDQAPKPSGAQEVTSGRPPAKVISGSVTG